jgi:ribosomal protein S18 acetylase RimI-like enzyme
MTAPPPIRPARPEEAPLLAALAERAYAPYLPVIGRRPAPMDDDYAARIAAGQAWVLEGAEAPLGLLVLEDRPGHLWIENVAVEPQAAGQGLGRQLLDFAFMEAERRGFTRIELLTNARMTRNISLYQRLGFSEYDRREHNGFDRVFMRKALGG